MRIRYTVIGVSIRLRAGRSGVRIPAGTKDYPFPPERPDRLWRPSSLILNGYLIFFPGSKSPGHEVDYLPASSTEVMSEWSCNPAPPVCLHGVVRHNFIMISGILECRRCCHCLCCDHTRDTEIQNCLVSIGLDQNKYCNKRQAVHAFSRCPAAV